MTWSHNIFGDQDRIFEAETDLFFGAGVLDNIAATRHIRKIRPEAQVILLTSQQPDEYIFSAMRAASKEGVGLGLGVGVTDAVIGGTLQATNNMDSQN